MKNIAVLFILFCSCNSLSEKEKEKKTAVPQVIVVAEDSMVTKLKPIILAIEKQELSGLSVLKQIMLDSVQYKRISLKEYCEVQKAQLVKAYYLSTNKEKTQKAISYLDKMIVGSVADKKLFEVQFHLNAALTNNIVYNEQHTKYLNEDLSELHLVFP